MRKFTLFLSVLALCAAARVFALELSLEENKAESGTVGYVDIDLIFKSYSGTFTAREEFVGEIKKKEGNINQRKREVYGLKADLARLRQEREFAATLPVLLSERERGNSAKIPAAAAQAVSTQSAAAVSAPASVAASSSPPVQVQGSTAAAAQAAAQPAQKPGSPSPPADGAIAMPGMGDVPMNYFKFSVSTAVPEIDAAIAAKEADLKAKEDALRLYQRQAEKELQEYESRKSELLLGRIYIVLKELAVREHVSVIIDKRNILFGHSAVDLTDKLIKDLEESQ